MSTEWSSGEWSSGERTIGMPIDRVDGRAKVTGAARYAVEHPVPGVTHAVLVTSTVAKGRISAIDTRDAEGVGGVLAVLTHQNAPRLPEPKPGSGPPARRVHLLQDDDVRYANQPVAVVVAGTIEAAQEAASLVEVRYAAQRPEVRLDPQIGHAYTPGNAGRPDQHADSRRGDVDGALARSASRIERLYRTPFETHNPMEPHATLAVWGGVGDIPRLTLYDATQGVFGCRRRVAQLLGLRPEEVRVVSPYLGGGFGSKGPTWSHVVLAAMAARVVGRPVKLALTRPQMFGPIGWRSQTRQTLTVGTRADGSLTALRHVTLAQTSTFDEFMEAASMPSRMLYACPNAATAHRLVRADIGTPSYMRAPGWAPGSYALECAIDEAAAAAGVDPLEFRRRNHAGEDPDKNRAWSSKALEECYRLGAERFGWVRRPRRPGVTRDGSALVGWGMATSVYPTHRSRAAARARLEPDGTLVVEAGTQDIGTGTYTVMSQVAADTLGVPVARVVFRLGDTRFPETPVSGGSQTAASAGSAVQAAVAALRARLVEAAVSDERSPVHGHAADDVGVADGRIVLRADSSRGEPVEASARRAGRAVEASGESAPGDEKERYSMYAFGAQFAEVRVDADLGVVRVSRMTGVFDIGRALNAKTVRSQLIGGMVWGLGMALTEETVFDERLGRVVNANLAEYHVPVNADVPTIEVSWVGGPDERANPIGVKGIGELGITGAAAAIANAVYHATGRRVRDLPITLDKVLAARSEKGGAS